MSDPYRRHDPYGDRTYSAESGSSWIVGGLLALFLVFGLIFMFGSRTGDQQTASSTAERGAPTTMSPQAPRAPAPAPTTTGSGASTPSTTGSGAAN